MLSVEKLEILLKIGIKDKKITKEEAHFTLKSAYNYRMLLNNTKIQEDIHKNLQSFMEVT